MGISVTAATLLSIIVEGILYGQYLQSALPVDRQWCLLYTGFSTFLFAITLWALTYQRKAAEVAHPMFAAACLLFIMSTMVCHFEMTYRLSLDSQHVIFNANRLWQGFISLDAADIEQFFEDVSKDTFKDILNELETLLGDAILVGSFIYYLFTNDSSGLF